MNPARWLWKLDWFYWIAEANERELRLNGSLHISDICKKWDAYLFSHSTIRTISLRKDNDFVPCNTFGHESRCHFCWFAWTKKSAHANEYFSVVSIHQTKTVRPILFFTQHTPISDYQKRYYYYFFFLWNTAISVEILVTFYWTVYTRVYCCAFVYWLLCLLRRFICYLSFTLSLAYYRRASVSGPLCKGTMFH